MCVEIPTERFNSNCVLLSSTNAPRCAWKRCQETEGNVAAGVIAADEEAETRVKHGVEPEWLQVQRVLCERYTECNPFHITLHWFVGVYNLSY